MRKANSGTQHTITSVRKDRNGEVLKSNSPASDEVWMV